MALTTKVAALSAPAATGDQDSPSLGLDPKAVIFFYGSQTATGGSSDGHLGIGFSGTAAEDINTYWNSDDAVTTSDTVRSTLTNAVLKSTVAGATTARITATMSSMGTDKFTANFSATVNTVKHPFLALGGADVTNAVAGSIASTTDTSNVVVNTLGFQPDIVFFSVQLITGTGTANNTSDLSFGVATSSSARWGMIIRSQNGAADANTNRAFFNNRILLLNSSTVDATVDEWDFVSMDSGGFTLSHPTASASAWTITYLAIKGGSWAVGNFNQPSSTGIAAAVSGLSFQPTGVLLGSVGYNTANTVTPNARMAIGAASSTTSRESVWVGDEDAAAVMKVDSYYSTTKVISLLDEAGGGSPTVLFDADLNSFDSGGFSLNTSTTDTVANIIGYVAFGNNASGSAIKTIDGLAKASSKTVNGLAIASVKTWDSLA